ncbi:hypothetical protein IFM89_035630 [Coptis chinensis]|uniref:Uncharacterized protein n=1 Tax=Coptis chinensis TaxID=261450 RepID=A0A835LTQ2_9MAGN|nr:hypothetical protein IFM89_035630 [Coptis chinensis]
MPLVDGFMYHCDSRGLYAVDLTSYLDNESDSNSNSGDESDEFYDRSVPVSGLEKVIRKYTHIDMEDPILVHLEDNRFSIIFHPYARPTEPAKLPCLTFSIERSGSAFTAKEEHFNFYLVTKYEFEALNALTIDTVVDADKFLEVCTSGDALSKDDHSGGYANEERARCHGSEKHAKERECIVPPADYVVEYVCGDSTVEGDVISKSEVSGKERSGFMLYQQHKVMWSVLTAVCLVAAVSIGLSRARKSWQWTWKAAGNPPGLQWTFGHACLIFCQRRNPNKSAAFCLVTGDETETWSEQVKIAESGAN